MKKNALIKLCVLMLTIGASTPSLAGPYADAIGQCFANSTTGKDRIELARWVFASMALHPDVVSSSSITPQKREAINQSTGALFNRLLAESCAKEVKEAVKFEGQAALKTAFESLGKLAMQELMSNPAVGAGFSGFEKYVDMKKVKKALE
ncbi:MAG: hypothetical protein ACYC4K_00500 [Thiobacillus sp.]